MEDEGRGNREKKVTGEGGKGIWERKKRRGKGR